MALLISNVRHYLSWIEELTTNQTVGGSNPSWRTTSESENRRKAVLFFLDPSPAGCLAVPKRPEGASYDRLGPPKPRLSAPSPATLPCAEARL